MSVNPFILVAPATRGLSLALTRHFLRTTDLPVFATHRSESAESIRERILDPLKDVDPKRLNLLPLDLTSEHSIAAAARSLSESLPRDAESYLHTAFLTGGILHPEKQPKDIDVDHIRSTFQVNVISHLLLIKHFSHFLPPAKPSYDIPGPSKWVHISARVGSISDNRRGGWYSYRASKAALNQVVKTFDLQLQMKKNRAICVGIHPGTVKTELSKGFWKSVEEGRLFEPEEAAENVAQVVESLTDERRGKIWDWEGKEVKP